MTSTNGPIIESEDPAPRPTRRRFSPEYKLRMVAEYDAAPTGEKGAILRRERLYHSHILEWRAARDAGGLTALTDRRTSPARPKRAAETAELERLRKKVARLEKDLAKRDTALQVMGKASALLELLAESAD
ncbi:transposase [Streptomyces sp. NPDC096198]|uniref:transposase n=1 Tax=Streptomyces sp. NPDC096198 TaxID=3366080 RepID=UPI00382F546B